MIPRARRALLSEGQLALMEIVPEILQGDFLLIAVDVAAHRADPASLAVGVQEDPVRDTLFDGVLGLLVDLAVFQVDLRGNPVLPELGREGEVVRL